MAKANVIRFALELGSLSPPDVTELLALLARLGKSKNILEEPYIL